MNGVQYEPLRGSIPARALQFLREQPSGTWVTSAVLGEAVGQTADTISPSLAPAIRHGIVVRRPRTDGTRGIEYALGDGKPPPQELDEDEPPAAARADQPAGRSVFELGKPWLDAARDEMAARGAPSAASVKAAEAVVKAAPRPRRATSAGAVLTHPARAAPPAPDDADAGFAVGIFDDQRLVIEQDGQVMVLKQPRAQRLVAFLAQFARLEAAA